MGYLKRFIDAVGSGLGAAVGGYLGGALGRGSRVPPAMRVPRRAR